MNQLERQLTQLRDIRLPGEVHARMREELEAYAGLHAAAPAAVQPKKQAFFSYAFRIYAGLAAFVLVIGSAGATAYAASDSLPGDALYILKTHVAEPIQTALIPSAKGKATWHAILAERRLDEASRLAAENRLSSSAQHELAANLDVQVEASAKNADRLERSGDPVGSLNVRSDLEARLTAHEQILSIVAAHYARADMATSTDSGIEAMLALVESHKAAIESKRLALEHALVPAAKQDTAVAVAATSSARVAVVTPAAGRIRVPAASIGVQVATADAARTEEVQSILSEHAVMLAKFLPPEDMGSTTASSTATTTATTTATVSATSTPASVPATTTPTQSQGSQGGR